MGISAPSLFSQSPPWRYDTDQKNRAQMATSQTVGGVWGGKDSAQHRLSVRGHTVQAGDFCLPYHGPMFLMNFKT